jgi:superoxide reductase
MQELIPGTTEASGEKHIPVYEKEGNTVHVTVGAAAHPMNREHYIEWVCLETEHAIQYAHLDPEDEPSATFSVCDGEEVQAVYAFCNQHDLWRK